MGISIGLTKAYFDSKGLRYRVSDDEKALSLILGGLKNKGDIHIVVFFDGDDRSVAVRAFDLVKVPDEKLPAMYKICSQMNKKYRWVKFLVRDGGSVTAEDDAIIQPDSCGEEIFELIMRMAGIVDEAYPEIMKTLWA